METKNKQCRADDEATQSMENGPKQCGSGLSIDVANGNGVDLGYISGVRNEETTEKSTDDVTSFGDETFATKLPSSAITTTQHQPTRATNIYHHP